jgi:hypothetical protein
MILKKHKLPSGDRTDSFCESQFVSQSILLVNRFRSIQVGICVQMVLANVK